MSTIIKLNNGKQYAFMKGASEYMLEVSNNFLEFETGNIIPINDSL